MFKQSDYLDVGQRLDDRFKITAETKNILKISILDC